MIPLRLAATLGGAAAVLLGVHLFLNSVRNEARRECEQAHQQAAQERFKENSDELSRIAARSRAASNAARESGRNLAAAAERLRGAVAGSGLVIRPAAPAGSAPASETELVSAELLRRLEDLAQFADDSHRAGTTCNEAYGVTQ